MKSPLHLLIFVLVIFSCNSSKKNEQNIKGQALIKYSGILEIEKFDNFYQVKVKKPNAGDHDYFTYILYRNKVSRPEVDADAYIPIPVKRAVCLSTSHLPTYAALDKSSVLIGFPNINLISNPTLLKSAEQGTLVDVGRKGGVNIEKVMTLQADFVMTYAMGSSMEQLKPLEKVGIPIILNTDYLETSPLARAEWLKLTAVLLDEYEKGDSIFKQIEREYLATKQLIRGVKKSETVMTGMMYGDIWYVPGGQSFAAQFIEDAGGHYLWSQTAQTGSLELSFESVLAKAQNATYWIGAGSFSSLHELENLNNKYALFDAFQTGQVYSYTKKVNEKGANDYLETGYMRADLVLKDYIKILYPEKLRGYSTTYFERLQP